MLKQHTLFLAIAIIISSCTRMMLNSFNTPDFATRPIQIDAGNMGNRIEAQQRVETKVRQ